jgi:predicted MFS family arabinose efflux permease
VGVPLLPTFELLVAGRLLQGAALAGIPALAMTLVHESATPLRAGALAGSYVAATSVGGLSGRLLAAPAGEWLGWRGGLVVVGVALAVLMAVLVVLLPRTGRADGDRRRTPSRGAVRAHLRDPRMLALCAVGGLLVGGTGWRPRWCPWSSSPTWPARRGRGPRRGWRRRGALVR